MKKTIFALCTLALSTVVITSCSEPDDEITSLTFGRNFSPTDLDSKSVSTTSARLVWTPVQNATSYVVEVFADDSLTFAGTPAQTLSTEAHELTVNGLVYDTKYSARVCAVTEGSEARTSKWSSVYFRTSAQQFMKSFKEECIADRSVIATWDAAAAGPVTTLKALNADGAVVSTKTLTAAEVAAGEATIDGLSPETTYTIKLYNGEKECGSRSVTTIADLNGATLLHSGDNLDQAIRDAAEGAVIALYGGIYEIAPDEEEGKMSAAKVEKSITIKGIYPTSKPTIKGRFEIYDGASLTISQAILDGSENKTGDQTFNYKTADVEYGPLNIQDCEIKNFEKGICYGNVTCVVESITFGGTLIHAIECVGGDFFDLRKSYVKTVTFSKCTIYDSAQERDLIRYDDASTSYTDAAPVIVVDQCTINNVCNVASGKRLLYVRFVGNSITWTNNIVSNTQAVYTNQSKTATPTYSNNYYFGCANANLFAASDPTADPKTYWSGDVAGSNGADPQYKDAANGDFTLGNEDVAKLKVGDPRWIR